MMHAKLRIYTHETQTIYTAESKTHTLRQIDTISYTFLRCATLEMRNTHTKSQNTTKKIGERFHTYKQHIKMLLAINNFFE